MTKNIFIVAIAVLLSVAFCSLSAQNVSKDYNVGDFFAINLQSVGNIIFAQGCEGFNSVGYNNKISFLG